MITRCRLFLILLVAGAGPLRAQTPLKPLAAIRPPAEQLIGVWHEHRPAGEEYATFLDDGRLIFKINHKEETMKWKLDASTTPWKLQLTSSDDPPVVLHTVVEVTATEFRMAPPTGDPEKIPGAEDLKKAPSMKRITLKPHGGIFQVVEAHLKGLSGTWAIKEGSNSGEITLATDGTWSLKTKDFSDKGRFRIDVRKVPCSLDFLSTVGAAPPTPSTNSRPADRSGSEGSEKPPMTAPPISATPPAPKPTSPGSPGLPNP